MAATAQLEEFDDALYKVVGGAQDEGEDQIYVFFFFRLIGLLQFIVATEKYLIATSEQPISAFHMNEWLEEGKLKLQTNLFSHFKIRTIANQICWILHLLQKGSWSPRKRCSRNFQSSPIREGAKIGFKLTVFFLFLLQILTNSQRTDHSSNFGWATLIQIQIFFCLFPN